MLLKRCNSQIFQMTAPKLDLKIFNRTGILSWPSVGLFIPSFEHNRPAKFSISKWNVLATQKYVHFVGHGSAPKPANLYTSIGETFC